MDVQFMIALINLFGLGIVIGLKINQKKCIRQKITRMIKIKR